MTNESPVQIYSKKDDDMLTNVERCFTKIVFEQQGKDELSNSFVLE